MLYITYVANVWLIYGSYMYRFPRVYLVVYVFYARKVQLNC